MPQARNLDSLRIMAPFRAENGWVSKNWADLLGPGRLGWNLAEVGNIGDIVSLLKGQSSHFYCGFSLTEEF